MIKNSEDWFSKSGRDSMILSLYGIVAIIGLSIAGVGIIWSMAHVWYHFSITVRMTLAVILLLLSQLGVAVAMFQDRQGTLAGDGVGVVHCLVVFVVLAMAEQSFYIGWDVPAFLVAGAVLCLPAAYLLRSVGCAAVYCAAVLMWAACGGAINAFGGAGFIWLLLLLIVPFYNLLVRHSDEVRLSIFSWVVTITVFSAFGFAARTEEYIPFLMLSALAVVIMLAGYSIDAHKAWGVPFRWFGRFAAAGSLLISCIPSSWDGIANIQGFHWVATSVTVLMFIVIGALLAKGVKKRVWAPIIYSFIPVLLAFETVMVRSAFYSSLPLIASSLYLLGLGFYEMVQGLKPGKGMHLKLGILILAGLVISFVIGTSVSVLVPLVAIIILALVFVQFRRSRDNQKAAAQRSTRRTKMKHNSTTLREGRKRKSTLRKRRSSVFKEEADPMEDILQSDYPDVQENMQDNTHESTHEDADTDTLDWMKDIHIPASFQARPAAKSSSSSSRQEVPPVPPVPVRTPPKRATVTTVIPKEPAASQFVSPIFHNPADIPVSSSMDAPHQSKAVPKQNKPMTSPWKDMKPAPKRDKHFTHSPWSQEGENRK